MSSILSNTIVVALCYKCLRCMQTILTSRDSTTQHTTRVLQCVAENKQNNTQQRINNATHSSTQQHTVTHRSALQDTATHCQTQQHTATKEARSREDTLIKMQYTSRHCNTLQHTATHCNTLQHTAIHLKTLQDTAGHCNTLQQAKAWIVLRIYRHTKKIDSSKCNTLQDTATHCNTATHCKTQRPEWCSGYTDTQRIRMYRSLLQVSFVGLFCRSLL